MIRMENDRELFEDMKKYLYTAVIGDILDVHGYRNQFLPPEVSPLRPEMVIAGRAMTVLEADMDADQVGVHNPTIGQSFGLMLEALDDLKPGEVYLCSGSSPSYALVGELMATRGKVLQAAGFVVNGYIRDTEGILKMDYPVFSYGCYAQDQAPRGKVIDYRVPLKIGNVEVKPGDIVFGDIDGVVIVPQDIEKQILKEAYEKATGENMVLEAIRNGMSATEAFDRYHIM